MEIKTIPRNKAAIYQRLYELDNKKEVFTHIKETAQEFNNAKVFNITCQILKKTNRRIALLKTALWDLELYPQLEVF